MLRLDEIKIERFRGIREGTISGLADVNILVGRNNCGKTTVCEAIMRAAQPTDAISRAGVDLWRIVRGEAKTWPPETYYCMQTFSQIRIGLSVTDGRMELVVDNERRGGVNIFHGPQESVIRFARRIAVFLPRDAANIETEKGLWTEMLRQRRDTTITDSLNAIFSMNADTFQLPPDGVLRMLFPLPKGGLPLDVQGDGTRAAMRCIMMLTVLQDTLFIIEEPETHQHPGSLEKFSLALCRQAKAQGVQLLITTHSKECVEKFLDAAKEAGSEGALFHLSLAEDGKLTARRLDAETVETVQKGGLDLRFLDLHV